jgi:hypothetical protein
MLRIPSLGDTTTITGFAHFTHTTEVMDITQVIARMDMGILVHHTMAGMERILIRSLSRMFRP